MLCQSNCEANVDITGYRDHCLVQNEIFSDQISVHFSSLCQNVLKSDLKTSRMCLICSQPEPHIPKSDIPAGLVPDSSGNRK